MYQNFIIAYLHEAQHVSGDTPPIIRSLKLHWQPLVFHTWKAVGRVAVGRCQAPGAWQRLPTTRPTTSHIWKTRGCQCSFRLLMMGGVSPETCWASFNLLAPEFYILILAHPVCKMWIIQEPKKTALWNKWHFEEKNGECVACLKYSVRIFVEKIYIKCNIWRVAVGPSYI